MCPMKQFTTLDTHDGISIVDVKDLIPDDEIENVKEQMYSRGANVKKIYSSEAYNNRISAQSRYVRSIKAPVVWQEKRLQYGISA